VEEVQITNVSTVSGVWGGAPGIQEQNPLVRAGVQGQILLGRSPGNSGAEPLVRAGVQGRILLPFESSTVGHNFRFSP